MAQVTQVAYSSELHGFEASLGFVFRFFGILVASAFVWAAFSDGPLAVLPQNDDGSVTAGYPEHGHKTPKSHPPNVKHPVERVA